MQTKRFQLDLSEQEHIEMERLMARAGIKTKREFVTCALSLFKWAANELANGRAVGSMESDGSSVRQLEMPALQPFARLAGELDRLSPSPQELRRRAEQPGISPEVVLAEMRKLLERAHASSPVRPGPGSPGRVGEVV